MTRDEAVSMIQILLGFRSDQTDNIITCLKTAQTLLESQPIKPWFLLSELSSIITTADEPRIELPSDFLMEYEENGLMYVPDNSDEEIVQLHKDMKDVLDNNYKLEKGAPEAYTLDGVYFRIYPIPDDTYTLKMMYYQKDTVLDTNVENEWLKYASYYLMGEAGQIIASALRDAKAEVKFKEWVMIGKDTLYRENEARKHTNTTPQIGGPE